MKLNYSKQITVCFFVILWFNILTTLLKHWIFHSIGYVLCGLLWVIHPVMIHGTEPTPKQKTILRIAGIAFILFGIFSRAYYY